MATILNSPRPQKSRDDCVSAAFSYLKRGWSPIPLPTGQKAPSIREWQKLRLEAKDVPHWFKSGMNIGVLLGEASNWLIDVDLDCAEALLLAPRFLPSTDAIFGRHSKPASHWLFRSQGSVDTQRLKGLDGAVLLELRANSCQTVFPPSIHSGESIEWAKSGLPNAVDGLQLRKSAVLLAIACLVTPHWPQKGSRHEFALSLVGGLISDAWTWRASAAS